MKKWNETEFLLSLNIFYGIRWFWIPICRKSKNFKIIYKKNIAAKEEKSNVLFGYSTQIHGQHIIDSVL